MSVHAALQEMIKLIGEYGFYVYLVLMAAYVAFIARIRRAALNDIRNSGSGWQETNRIVHAILIERYSNRRVPALFVFYGMPILTLFLALLPFLISSSGKG